MIIFRYILTAIVQSTFAVALVLLLIVTSGRLAKYLSKASTGELAPELVFSIILFRIPDFLPLIIPLALFVGTLLVYGRMYIDSEMIALSAAGVSKWHIMVLTLSPAFLVSMLVALLTLWLAPASLVQVEKKLEEAKNFHGLMFFREGAFQANHRGDSVAYVERLPTRNTFESVFVVEQKPDKSLTLMLADAGEARQTENAEIRELELQSGAIYEGSIGQRDFQVSRFDSYRQNIRIAAEQESIDLKTDMLPTLGLLNSRDVKKQTALHWRFSLPATVIVVSLLAMALSKTDRRRGRYLAMLPAILLYLIYIISLSAIRSSAEEMQLPVVALWLAHGFFLLLAFILIYREELTNKFIQAKTQRA